MWLKIKRHCSRRRARPVGRFPLDAACRLASFSYADSFDNARGFVTLLACEATWDEAKKRRLTYQAQKLLQESALDRNFLKGPREQLVDRETGRIRRANASNISLLIDVQPVTGEGNGCVSVGVGEVSNALEERLLVWSSLSGYPNQTAVLFLGQDHAVINPQSSSELRSALHA